MKIKTPKLINILSATAVISFKDDGGFIIMEKTVEIAVPTRVADRLAKVETSDQMTETQYELHKVFIRDKDMRVTGYDGPDWKAT